MYDRLYMRLTASFWFDFIRLGFYAFVATDDFCQDAPLIFFQRSYLVISVENTTGLKWLIQRTMKEIVSQLYPVLGILIMVLIQMMLEPVNKENLDQ